MYYTYTADIGRLSAAFFMLTTECSLSGKAHNRHGGGNHWLKVRVSILCWNLKDAYKSM